MLVEQSNPWSQLSEIELIPDLNPLFYLEREPLGPIYASIAKASPTVETWSWRVPWHWAERQTPYGTFPTIFQFFEPYIKKMRRLHADYNKYFAWAPGINKNLVSLTLSIEFLYEGRPQTYPVLKELVLIGNRSLGWPSRQTCSQLRSLRVEGGDASLGIIQSNTLQELFWISHSIDGLQSFITPNVKIFHLSGKKLYEKGKLTREDLDNLHIHPIEAHPHHTSTKVELLWDLPLSDITHFLEIWEYAEEITICISSKSPI